MRGAILAAALAALAGCSTGPAVVDVTGTVTFDGTPIPEGEVVLLAADNGVPPEAGPIRDGAFALKVQPGPKKVRVNAVRKIDKRGPMGEPFMLESYIPDRYNARTELTAEVPPGGPAVLRFDLTSGGGKP